MSILQRASVVELRRAQALASELIKAGIDFVPVPIESIDQKIKLTHDLLSILDRLEKEASKNECK